MNMKCLHVTAKKKPFLENRVRTEMNRFEQRRHVFDVKTMGQKRIKRKIVRFSLIMVMSSIHSTTLSNEVEFNFKVNYCH